MAVFDFLSSLTDPTDPFITKYMKDRLGDARLKALDDAPALRALIKSVAEEKGIKKWLETRPSNAEEGF